MTSFATSRLTLGAAAAATFGLGQLQAAVLIPSDVSVGGVMVIEDFFGTELAVSEGTFYATVGGVDITNEFKGPPGSVLPEDFIVAGLTHHGGGLVGGGDGFGYTWEMESVSQEGGSPEEEGGPGFETVTDLFLGAGEAVPMIIENNSVDTAYQFFLSLSYSHLVSAFGDDAYAESDLEIEVDDIEVVEFEVLSDTYYGNSIDKIPTEDFGGEVSDSGVYPISFRLEPGESASVGFDWTGEAFGFVGETGASGNATGFLSLDNIVAVPEPNGSAVLAGLMALGLATRRRG